MNDQCHYAEVWWGLLAQHDSWDPSNLRAGPPPCNLMGATLRQGPWFNLGQRTIEFRECTQATFHFSACFQGFVETPLLFAFAGWCGATGDCYQTPCHYWHPIVVSSPQAVQIIFTRVRFGTHRRGTLEKVSKRMKLLERTFFLFSDNHFLYADKNVSDNAVRYANPRTGPSSALAHAPNFQRKYDVTHFCAFPRHVMWSGNFV